MPETTDTVAKSRKVYGDQAYKLKRKLISALCDVYARARHFRMTHDELSEGLRESVYEPAQRLGAAERAYIDGYAEAKRAEVWRSQVMWMLSVDGRLMTSKEVDALTREEATRFDPRDPAYKSPWSRVDNNKSCHVWVDMRTGEPLRDKPFSGTRKTEQEVG